MQGTHFWFLESWGCLLREVWADRWCLADKFAILQNCNIAILFFHSRVRSTLPKEYAIEATRLSLYESHKH